MRFTHRTTITEIYEQIVAFADEKINGIGGNWRERQHKRELFVIFSLAYQNGHCSPKRTQRSTVLITGDSIFSHLRDSWMQQAKSLEAAGKLMNDVQDWWDEWTYAWDRHPIGMKRMYIRSRQKVPHSNLKAIDRKAELRQGTT